MKVAKHVTVAGLRWAVLSANERTTTHAGRHFFAVRCNPSRAWRIHEHDCDITQAGSAKPLRVWTNFYVTRELSQSVKEICGELPEFRVCHTCFATYRGAEAMCPACFASNVERHPCMTSDEYWAAIHARRDAMAKVSH